MTRRPWDEVVPRVKIVKRPDGEAPEWVRDAWIGLELPLLKVEPVKTRIAGGVLTGPRTVVAFWLRFVLGRTRYLVGYEVDAFEAVNLLQSRNPTAAMWWRSNAGWCVQPGCVFLFDVPACERAD